MLPILRPRLALLALMIARVAAASESTALLDALIRKGILTPKEAEDIRAEVAQEGKLPPAPVRAAAKATDRLSMGMRMQVQYAHLDTEIDGAIRPPATNHFFLRRMYLSLKAEIGANWEAVMVYDLASNGYDDATIEWKPTTDLKFDFGLRKVNVAFEERATSGDIRAIERSSVTRYFVEANNGRRLGAASYRVGAFLDGKQGALVYSAAITTPERNETFNLASSSGDGATNRLALWAGVGLTGKVGDAMWIAGVGAGHLPDQGGFGVANLGRGADLDLLSVYANVKSSRYGFMGELLTARVQRGAATGGNAQPVGYFLQPTLMLTGTIEAVVRYAWLDSDHRGVTLADVIRSAPGGITMNRLAEWYAGTNWYLKGNDLKYQLGVVYGETRDLVIGVGSAEAKVVGVRSQLQLQF